jgi:leader peptidase (prepilin peptidase)/N-methyltransferase
VNIPVLAVLIGYGTWLSVIDARTHRLPNRHVAAMSLLMVLAMAITRNQITSLGAVLASGLGSVAVYAVIYLISRGQFGMGDVKFSLPLGFALGALAPGHWLDALILAFFIAGVSSLPLLAFKRATRESRIAFGPYMTIATVVTAALFGG